MDFTPQTLGRYRLLERIGLGGMAEVLLAQIEGPAGFSKRLVVKRIHPHLAEDEEFVRMFLDEARLAAMLDHPNIVHVFELCEHEGEFFVAMDHVDGPSLRALCRRAAVTRRPLPVAYAAKIVSLIGEALGYAHDLRVEGEPLGFVHRDVTPENILLSKSGAVKLVDFGIAKAAIRSSRTGVGQLKGKVRYMSPEQLRGGHLDRRTDIFALGVVLFEALTGVLPFTAPTDIAAMDAVLCQPPTPVRSLRPECPEDLAAVIDRALEKDPARRFPSCLEMRGAIERCLLRLDEPVGAPELAEWVANAAKVELGSDPNTQPNTAPGRVSAGAITDVVLRGGGSRCPRCSGTLKLARIGSVEVDGCPGCGGIWFDEGELQELANHPQVLLVCSRRFRPHGQPELVGNGRCPRCTEPLESFEFDSLRGIGLDRCRRCNGVWLDPGEAEEIDARLAGEG